MGLGSAYIDGLSKCTGDFIILMDADLSHHVSQFYLTFSLNSFLTSSEDNRKQTVTWSQAPGTFLVGVFTAGI